MHRLRVGNGNPFERALFRPSKILRFTLRRRVFKNIANLLQQAGLLRHAQAIAGQDTDAPLVFRPAMAAALVRCVMLVAASNGVWQVSIKTWIRAAVLLVAMVLAACAAQPDTDKPGAGSDAAADNAEEVRLWVETSEGAMLWAVYPGKAPVTANNFLRLVDARVYDGGSFYRTVRPDNDRNPATINVIQGGISRPDVADAKPAPFPPIAHESTADSGLRHVDGALSMARLEPGSAQAEFFVSIGDNPVLDAGGTRNPDKLGFAVFGQVLQGMEVVRKIHASSANAPTDEPYVQGQMLDAPVRIISIRRQSNPPNKSI